MSHSRTSWLLCPEQRQEAAFPPFLVEEVWRMLVLEDCLAACATCNLNANEWCDKTGGDDGLIWAIQSKVWFLVQCTCLTKIDWLTSFETQAQPLEKKLVDLMWNRDCKTNHISEWRALWCMCVLLHDWLLRIVTNDNWAHTLFTPPPCRIKQSLFLVSSFHCFCFFRFAFHKFWQMSIPKKPVKLGHCKETFHHNFARGATHDNASKFEWEDVQHLWFNEISGRWGKKQGCLWDLLNMMKEQSVKLWMNSQSFSSTDSACKHRVHDIKHQILISWRKFCVFLISWWIGTKLFWVFIPVLV